MNSTTFWGFSVLEIIDYLNAFAKRRKQEIKEKVSMYFMLAEITSVMNPMTDKKKVTIPKPWDYYPGLFEEDKEKFEEQQRQTELENYKMKRIEQMRRFNEKRRRGGVNDGEED